MGAWGTAIFSDDDACDVRDGYRQLVTDGLTGPKATKQLLREWKEVLDDEDDGPLFWLALAAAQWQFGRLEARVKSRALKIIADGSSLGRWSEEGGARALRQRKAVLEKLGARLRSPQPPAQRFRKPRENASSWVVSEVLAYRLRSQKIVLLHIANPGRGRLDRPPIFTVLDWIGKTPPDPAVIESLPLKGDQRHGAPVEFMTVGRLLKAQAERFTSMGVQRKPHREMTGGFIAFLWKDLDSHLKEQCGWK
jgi:hypothetical protein